MSQRWCWKWPRHVVLAVAFCLLAAPAPAKGKLDFVENFKTGDLELDVSTYTDPEVAPYKVGLLGLAAGSTRNSFAFRGDEWQTLIDLVAKAARAKASGIAWSVVGEMTETGTSDLSHLVVSAGSGIRFALNSAKGASLTYVLAKADVPRFQRAIGKVKAYFAAR